MGESVGLADSFGETIRRIRKEKHLSQEQLAFESRLDRTYISLLERGLRQPTLKTLFQISKTLQTPPSEVVRQMEDLLDENKQN